MQSRAVLPVVRERPMSDRCDKHDCPTPPGSLGCPSCAREGAEQDDLDAFIAERSQRSPRFSELLAEAERRRAANRDKT